MSGRGLIPETILTELRERASILEVVGGHVGLRRVGRNHVGLCPFHAEKTPSFTVNEERGIFHCFGCGASGNVFTFLSRLENLPFPEIVERLARRYGVILPARGSDDPATRARERLLGLNDKTARFFERHLWESSEAAPARAYLDERGIDRAVAERFRLGWAPGGGAVLAGRLTGAQALDDAVRLGLIAGRRGGGGHYDRFRARLTFPITDTTGRVVGFGSRSVPGTASASGDLPKYLNSPETPLYRKGAHLYGLALARHAVRGAGRAVVVEGYFDVLALVAAGVGHVVASLGTALTLEQLRVLKRFTRDIVVCFDGDAAGERAAERSLPTFLEAGLWGHAVFLPAGDDPDTFVRREGQAALERLLAGATPLLDFYLDRSVRPDSTVGERARVAPDVARLLGTIDDPFEYNLAVQRAAERIGIAEELLRRRSRPAASAPPDGPRSAPRATSGGSPTLAAADAEEWLVTLMLEDPAATERVLAAGGAALFEDPHWHAVVEAVAAAPAGAVDAATLLAELEEGRAGRVAARLLEEGRDGETRAHMVEDCLRWLAERTLERRRQAVLREIRAAESSGDAGAVSQALRRLSELRQGAPAPARGS